MSWSMIALSFIALFAGMLNSIAGGGSFFTFPALLWSGMAPISANATNTLALLPGSFSSAYAYRDDLALAHQRMRLHSIVIISILGGSLGSWLLLVTPAPLFMRLVPWLLLFATVIFLGGRPLSLQWRRIGPIGPRALGVLQFCIGVYGGYFGGGIGILMLALLGLFGLEDLHVMNGVKTLLAGAMNLTAALIFIAAGQIDWRLGLPMAVSATLGGWLGVHAAKRIAQQHLRWGIGAVAIATTAYFFWQQGA